MREARNRLWQARHDAYWAAVAFKPAHRGITTDVCVPISRLAEAVLGAKEAAKASGLTSCIVGHVGDGNFHCLILFPEGSQDGLEQAWALDRAIVAQGLALGGTCSGEHGVGLGKREFLEQEHGAGGARGDARHQGEPRPARHPESGQDVPELIAMAHPAAAVPA